MKNALDYLKNKFTANNPSAAPIENTSPAKTKQLTTKIPSLTVDIPTLPSIPLIEPLTSPPITVPKTNITAAMAGISLEKAATLDNHIHGITKVFAEIPTTGHIMLNSTIHKVPQQEFEEQLQNIRKHGKKSHYTEIAKQVGKNMTEMRELNKDSKMNNYTTMVLQQIVDKKNGKSSGRSV